jgi:hypothetical protein
MKATSESFAAMLDEARIDSESFTHVVGAGEMERSDSPPVASVS